VLEAARSAALAGCARPLVHEPAEIRRALHGCPRDVQPLAPAIHEAQIAERRGQTVTHDLPLCRNGKREAVPFDALGAAAESGARRRGSRAARTRWRVLLRAARGHSGKIA
jgi:hypothetical protein